MSFAATQMDLETVILSEEVKDRQISYDMAYMWNVGKKKKGTNELTYKTEIESLVENKLVTRGEKGRGQISWEIDIHTLLYIK